MKVKVYKIELLVYDFENGSEEDMKNSLENLRYYTSRVKNCEMRQVEWTDDHPLNKKDTSEEAYRNLFNS